MTILFYNFSKKKNSTAIPSGAGTSFTCSIKTPSSVQSPVVELRTVAAPLYNYAYISDFGRYYFVTDITFNMGVWEISLSCDVLASFKTDIGSTSMYILRSSAQKDPNLVDTRYPVSAAATINRTQISAASTGMWTTGSFVLTILDGDSNTGNTTYQFSPTEFGKFIDSIMVTGSDMQESVWDAITQSIRVTVFEPLRYIGACFWFPSPAFTPGPVTATTSIKLGNFTATGFSCYAIDGTALNTMTYTVTLPAHPQAAARGSYCNLEPFSEYCLNLGPFGNLKLDSTAIAKATSMTITIKIDPFTGKARAIIKTNLGAVIANVATQWGVPIAIANGSTVNIGGAGQTLTGAATALIGAAAGDVMGAGAGLMNYVKGISDLAKGAVSTVGSTGAMVDHQYNMEFIARFFTIADDDNTNNGRPYCAVNTPATLTGYMEAEKGLVVCANASKPELDAVNAYMEGGFYYE